MDEESRNNGSRELNPSTSQGAQAYGSQDAAHNTQSQRAVRLEDLLPERVTEGSVLDQMLSDLVQSVDEPGGLLRLLNRIWDVADDRTTRPHGNVRRSNIKIDQFPTTQISEQQAGDECTVCLLDYKVGETVRQLPCGHCFHTDCLTTWFRQVSAVWCSCKLQYMNISVLNSHIYKVTR